MRRKAIDRLALLCTLHADGPRSLRLLREIGCHSIKDLGELPPESIGRVLNLPAAAARRLTREATLLNERLEPELELEEVTYPPASGPRLVSPGSPAPISTGERIESEAETQALSRLDLRDRELLDRVVHRWQSAELERDPVQEDPQPAPQGTAVPKEVIAIPLQPGVVEGLDEKTCSALLAVDIQSVEDLVACSVDELVSRAHLPFVHARTLQFRAGKRVGGTPLAQSLPAEQERFSPSDRPPCETPSNYEIPRPADIDESGAAGPFA